MNTAAETAHRTVPKPCPPFVTVGEALRRAFALAAAEREQSR